MHKECRIVKGRVFSGQLRWVALAWGGLAFTLLPPVLAGAQENRVPEAESQEKVADSGESESRTETLVLAQEARTFDLLTAKRLTGDWGGVRSDLEDLGIRFKIDVMNHFMVNMHGGREVQCVTRTRRNQLSSPATQLPGLDSLGRRQARAGGA